MDDDQPSRVSADPAQADKKESSTSSSTSSGEDALGAFECNICLDTAKEPVVTTCGHLYCWPCMYRWLDLHPDSQSCPVCKASVDRDKLIPLYGRGGVDPRTKVPDIPKRPQGQRGESVRQSNPQRGPIPDNFFAPPGFSMGPSPFGHTAWNSNVGGVNLGIGFFPPLFGMQFHAGGFQGNNGQPPTPEELQQQQLSKAMLALGLFILFCILFM